MVEREFALEIVKRLRGRGFQALWAGGCVRDELLGLEPADYDVATDAEPKDVRAIFQRTVEVGESFGVVEVIGPRGPDGEWLKVQVATFRTDGPYSDGRRPDSVRFSTPKEDAERRDFTINGMFHDPISNEIIDYVGGRADLDARILRAIGDPYARFREDKLRILRGVRMAVRFDLTTEPHTRQAMAEMAPEIVVVSAERIMEELRKLLTHPRRVVGVRLLIDLGLLRWILPELLPIVAKPALTEAALSRADRLRRPLTPLVLAALFYDLSFGKRDVQRLGERLKFANAERDALAWLLDQRTALRDAPTLPKSTLYPLLIHPGAHDLIELHRVVAEVEGRPTIDSDFCSEVLRNVAPDALNPPPLLTGDDLRAAGHRPGPIFKTVLDAVRRAQLDGSIRDRAAAADLARRLLNEAV